MLACNDSKLKIKVMPLEKNYELKSNANYQINTHAKIIRGKTENGKPCQLIDNTGTIDDCELDSLLNQLLSDKQFGINALSSSNGVIAIDKPRLTHIQIKDELYRLLIFRYDAIIEKF